jgi:hypothetical protein
MPILVLKLQFVLLTGTYKTVEIFGSLPRQPIQLTEYNIQLTEPQPALDSLHVSLPFLNSYDSNTNFDISGAIPLFLEKYFIYSGEGADTDTKQLVCYQNYSRECSYEFNLGQNVPQSFNNWRVYNESGELFTSCGYTITLVFNYRRPEIL